MDMHANEELVKCQQYPYDWWLQHALSLGTLAGIASMEYRCVSHALSLLSRSHLLNDACEMEASALAKIWQEEEICPYCQQKSVGEDRSAMLPGPV